MGGGRPEGSLLATGGPGPLPTGLAPPLPPPWLVEVLLLLLLWLLRLQSHLLLLLLPVLPE